MPRRSHFLFGSLSFPIWQVGPYQVTWLKDPRTWVFGSGVDLVLGVVGGEDVDNSGLTWTEGGACRLEVTLLSNGIRLRFET